MLGPDDLPMRQTGMSIPLQITLPKQAMPATAGRCTSSSTARAASRRASSTSAGRPTPVITRSRARGPGYVVALHGIAAASSALPLNPERYPGANDYQYLNINN